MLKTQSVAAVRCMLESLNRPTEPLPLEVWFDGIALVLSAKKDVYFTVSVDDCSCAAHQLDPSKRCRHQRRYFSLASDTLKASSSSCPGDSLIDSNQGAWNGRNGPVLEVT
jgi:hypothetical protein